MELSDSLDPKKIDTLIAKIQKDMQEYRSTAAMFVDAAGDLPDDYEEPVAPQRSSKKPAKKPKPILKAWIGRGMIKNKPADNIEVVVCALSVADAINLLKKGLPYKVDDSHFENFYSQTQLAKLPKTLKGPGVWTKMDLGGFGKKKAGYEKVI